MSVCLLNNVVYKKQTTRYCGLNTKLQMRSSPLFTRNIKSAAVRCCTNICNIGDGTWEINTILKRGVPLYIVVLNTRIIIKNLKIHNCLHLFPLV